MADGEPLPRPERRHQPRQRALKGALIVTGHTGAYDCVVRNLSEDGAKLTLPSTIGIPDTFSLMLPAEQRMAPARAIWRTGTEIGIAFAGPFAPHKGRG